MGYGILNFWGRITFLAVETLDKIAEECYVIILKVKALDIGQSNCAMALTRTGIDCSQFFLYLNVYLWDM